MSPGDGWLTARGGGISGLRWLLDGVIIQVMVRWAVPVFIMISGFLLLNPAKEIPLKKIRKYVLRMTVALLTFGYVYCLIESVVSGGLADIPALLLYSAAKLLEGKSWSHMWYVYMMIGLYLFTPMLRTFANNADYRIMGFTMAVLLVLTIIRPTVNLLTGMEIPELIPVSTPYLFYYLAGYCLPRCRIEKRHALILLAIGVAGTVASMYIGRDMPETAAAPENIFIAILASGLFALAMKSAAMEKLSHNVAISSMAKYSFGIYLVHPFFLNVLNKGLHIFPDVMPAGIGEVVFFTVTWSISFLVIWILCRNRMLAMILV